MGNLQVELANGSNAMNGFTPTSSQVIIFVFKGGDYRLSESIRGITGSKSAIGLDQIPDFRLFFLPRKTIERFVLGFVLAMIPVTIAPVPLATVALGVAPVQGVQVKVVYLTVPKEERFKDQFSRPGIASFLY